MFGHVPKELLALRKLAENQTVVFYNGEPGKIQRMNEPIEEYAFHYEGGAIPLVEDELVIEGHHIHDIDLDSLSMMFAFRSTISEANTE
jgi:hypothetical protein